MATMLSRFRGSMLGHLMSDCLGSPFESEAAVGKHRVATYFSQLMDPKKRLPYKPYTDDTAMAKSVALLLCNCGDYHSEDMARRFTTDYFNEPKRGYGSAIHDVFIGLRNSNFEDPYRPAMRQFQGLGSFGNGAAMRVHPVALRYCTDEAKAIEVATLQAKLTHYHVLGYQGAILECLAISQALNTDDGKVDVVKFTDDLISKMKEIESKDKDLMIAEMVKGEDPDAPWNTTSYAKRLETVKKFLASPEPPPLEEIQNLLGVNVSALKSVPTAIYCFLVAQRDIPEIECTNKVQRCIQFAISLGGDTDTIAAMAGAIAGAHFGEEEIPEQLLKHCEAVKEVIRWADQLHTASQTKSQASAKA